MARSSDSTRYPVPIVEEDALVRAEAAALCIEVGFTTYEAQNADQAMPRLELHSQIRVLFADVERPGTMGGPRLARAVRERWPPVTIMVTSGRVKLTEDDMPENGLFFEKPCSPDGIIKALDAVAMRIQG